MWTKFKELYLFDYTRTASLFWMFVTMLGVGFIGLSMFELAQGGRMFIIGAVGFGLANILFSMYPIRLPGTTMVFVAGDVLVYLAMILFGPPVAAAVASIEGMVATSRTSVRLSSSVFSTALSTTSAYLAGTAYQFVFNYQPKENLGATWMFAALFLGICVHWILQSTALALLIRLKKKTILNFRTWLSEAAAPGAIQFGSGLIASIIAVIWEVLPMSSLGIVLVFLTTFLLLMLWNFKHFVSEKQKHDKKIEQVEKQSVEQQALAIHLAYHDALTGLVNRRKLNHAMNNCFLKEEPFALMYIDLDRFKLVNDNLGHAAGDLLLREVSKRLLSCVRKDDIVARVGGDEFCILIRSNSKDAVLEIAEEIIHKLSISVLIDQTDVRPLASIGVAFSHQHVGADELLSAADLAMYFAKREGRARVKVYDEQMSTARVKQLQLESDLREAIQKDTLTMMYQPIVDLSTKKIVGFEALVRWDHPILGKLSPAKFIPLAEEGPLILKLTEWAILKVAKLLGEWNLPEVKIHVNVSAKDIASETFVMFVQECLQNYSVPKNTLVIELTERSVMMNKDQALKTLHDLSEIGVQLSIDDFGTGYSSLSYLSTLEFDCLKIDQTFVAGMESTNENFEIVVAIVALATALHKQTIAEGVETNGQLEKLVQIGATHGQGYLFSHPLSAENALLKLTA